MAYYKKEKKTEENIAENIYRNQNKNLNVNPSLENNTIIPSGRTISPSRAKGIDKNSKNSPTRSLFSNLVKKNSNSIQTDLANKPFKSKNPNNSLFILNYVNSDNNVKDTTNNQNNNFKETPNINFDINNYNNNIQKKKPESETNIKKQSKKSIINLLKLKASSNNNNDNNNNENNCNSNSQITMRTGDPTIYTTVDAKYDEIFLKLNIEYEPKKYEYESQIEKIDKDILQLDSDIKLLKSNLEILFSKQREYYMDLLSKGIDVRSEGLTWIVKRLIELNAVIDNSIFPRFLDRAQIEFITFISYKSVEISQIKMLMKMLRAKQLKENKTKRTQKNMNIMKFAKQITGLKSDNNINTNSINVNLNKNNEEPNTNYSPDNKGLDSKETNEPNKVTFKLGSRSEKELNEDNNNKNENAVTEMNEMFIHYNRKNSCEMFFNTSYTGKNSGFYLKSFSEKALNIFDNIFKKYEIIGINRISHFLEDKLVINYIFCVFY